MEPSQGLAETWRAHAVVHVVVPDDSAKLEQLLGGAFDVARSRWPSVILRAEQFVAQLTRRLPKKYGGSALEKILAEFHLAELYLACACAAGDPAAIAIFDQQYLTKLPARLGAGKIPAALIDDVCQMVREKLLVRTAEGEPHLATYSGKGELLNFVYVIGVRMASRLKTGSEEDLPDVLPAPGPNTDLDLIRRQFRDEFQSAVREACEALTPRERHLLTLHYARKVPTTKIANMSDVNQSTISRQLKDVRQEVYEMTKDILKERLRLSSGDFESLLVMLESHLDISISLIFNEEDEED